MKTYKKVIKGSVYFVLLMAAVLQLYFSNSIMDKQSQPVASVEYNQQLSNKEESETDMQIRKSKASAKKTLRENPVQTQSGAKNSGSEKGVTILMYHYTSEKTENYMSIPRDKFREQMKYLKDNRYNIISLDELYSHYNDGTQIPDNAVVITFDDGYANNYIYAYPILKELGFKATIFVITSKLDQYLYLTKDQLKELDKNGVSIECHTVNHPELSHLSYYNQLDELKNSKLYLEKILGREIKYIAYPFGEFNDDTINIATELKYKGGVGTVPGKARKSNGQYTLNRIAVRGPIDMPQFKVLLNKN